MVSGDPRFNGGHLFRWACMQCICGMKHHRVPKAGRTKHPWVCTWRGGDPRSCAQQLIPSAQLKSVRKAAKSETKHLSAG